MKFRNIYKIAALLALALVFQSRMNGPGAVQNLQVTGAPGSTGNQGTCANSGCHSGGTFSPTQSMSLFEGANLVDKYEPGKTYTLKISNQPNNGIPAVFGFQAVALNASNAQAGNWGAPGANKHVVTINNRKYIEHSVPLTNGVFELPWIAPAAGTGPVTFYAASLSGNGNDQNTGDSVAKNMFTVQELVSGIADLDRPYASLKVLPNPVNESLNLEVTSRKAGDFQLRFADLSGAVVKEEPLTVQVGVNRQSFDVADLAPGLYILQLCGEGHLAATQMLKN